MADTSKHNGTRGYFEGFYDCIDLEPLFDDASQAYRAGYLASLEAKKLFDQITEPEGKTDV